MQKASIFDEAGTPPSTDEIEVTVIGPGFGECVLIHIGDGKWIVVDCCALPNTPQPAPLAYLRALGLLDPDIHLLIISHWDEDHCRGLADLVAAAPGAQIIMAKAFLAKDFLAYSLAHDSPLTRSFRSGVKEINRVMRLLDAQKRPVIGAYPARRILGPADLPLSHGRPVEVWSLSPSDDEHANFLAWVSSQMPKVDETRRVAIRRKRNDLSIVLHVSVGADTFLLGGDLEEHGKLTTGWSAVLGLGGRPQAKAQIFKVPHHGSKTGHHADVPPDLLDVSPVALLAPFKNGNVSLPTQADVTRIVSFSGEAWSTATLKGRANPRRDPSVEKTIKDVALEFTTIKQEPGAVRLRKKLGASGGWTVERFGSACLLKDVH